MIKKLLKQRLIFRELSIILSFSIIVNSLYPLAIIRPVYADEASESATLDPSSSPSPSPDTSPSSLASPQISPSPSPTPEGKNVKDLTKNNLALVVSALIAVVLASYIYIIKTKK